MGGAKVGDLAAIALVDLETIGGGAFSFLSSTEEKKKKNLDIKTRKSNK